MLPTVALGGVRHAAIKLICLAGVVLLVFASGCTKADPNAVPRGFDEIDHDIRIGVLHGQLRYDVEEFAVRPGSKVKITLTNDDSMQHNLLICRPGKKTLDRVSAAVVALGDRASARDFVPRLGEVLWHTKALLPGKTQSLYFRAPKTRGRYPYICTLPGHTYTMRGVMVVGDVPEPILSDVRYRVFEGRFRLLADLEGQKATTRGTSAKPLFDLSALEKRANYGVWFDAKFRAPQSGEYTFFLRSDDGSRVRVKGREVVAHDGTHPPAPFRPGKVRLAAGVHDLRVEFFQGGGGQLLAVEVEGPGLARTALTPKGEKRQRVLPIMVMHRPVVMRVHVEDASARTIAVGLPDGINYAFDADACRVQFGWAGAFLDVAPDRLGRGGRPCRTLGQRFAVGDVGFPLRRPGQESSAARFVGYETGPSPRFSIDWDGQSVVWSIGKAGGRAGLRYDFELPNNEAGVSFAIARAGLDVESSAGEWRGDTLELPRGTSEFSVTLRTRAEGK